MVTPRYRAIEKKECERRCLERQRKTNGKETGQGVQGDVEKVMKFCGLRQSVEWSQQVTPAHLTYTCVQLYNEEERLVKSHCTNN